MDPLYITTPIYYVNGDPHIGHAHTSVMGDILKRCHLMKGGEVFYSTGTDEHGQKNQEAIIASGLTPEEYLSRQSRRFRELFDRLNVSYDYYMRTTDETHKKVVQHLLVRLHDAGLIYKKDYSGLYCVGCEQFKKVSDLDSEGRCPDHLTKPIKQTEENYFLKAEPFQEWLIKLIKDDPELIQPEMYQREVLSMLSEPLDDICISRPKSRVWLGIELPFAPDFVTYVWFDALINYISNIGYGTSPDFQKWWNHSLHLMAKDIVKTHIIYWPIMLRAAGIAPPHRFRIHGYWVGEGGQKMAKSLGNVVEPGVLIQRVGVDGLRYYLAKMMGGTDSQISLSLVESCYNTDLANNIGNLHSRVHKFTMKRVGHAIRKPGSITESQQALRQEIIDQIHAAIGSIDLGTIPAYVQTALNIAHKLNLYFNDAEPWKTIKIPEKKEEAHAVLYVMMDALRLLFEFLSPVIPETAERALKSLGARPVQWEPKTHRFMMDAFPENAELQETEPLFPRL